MALGYWFAFDGGFLVVKLIWYFLIYYFERLICGVEGELVVFFFCCCGWGFSD